MTSIFSYPKPPIVALNAALTADYQFRRSLGLTNGMVWSPFVRAAWVHEFRPDRSISSSFVSVPGTLFPVDGARAWIERR